ncbi:mannitol dehydrogenase family protein [Flavimaricola marinus]|uniref:Polyol:NADP oxidoreductase n=1 Tax=Flavimaricola marinus TaxID=1819565 RepID=A0A238LJ10_9RHOB|nr:mannitol dehydrogenase family protein [Flavimaricola marinus]SMY08946.1 Polyol:NADP oxidoreductase [Flavimaricola marinus]
MTATNQSAASNRLRRSETPRPGTGIVHLGLGAFFRGFGCVYVADAMAASGGDWGIVGVSLRSPETRNALADQDWAYTSVTLAKDGEAFRQIEVLNDVLVAPEDPEAVIDAMADPGVKIVTLTVTEKGYCHNPATGRINLDHPLIQADLMNPLPQTAPGFLVRALQRRKVAGVPPFTVLSCDNLPSNGKLVCAIVLELADRIDPALAQWIAQKATFPSTMVDRITPATTEADILRVQERTGQFDAAPVLHEPFYQWAVEDDFVGGQRPDLAAAGAEMVADVTAHENMKLRMLNGTHSSLAYLGFLAGHETIAETVADPVFASYVRNLWSEEITPTLIAPPGVNLADYADELFDRYANPAIRHLTYQIAMDGSQKLPQRLLATMTEAIDAGRNCRGLCLAVAAWMRYVGGVDEAGQPILVKDPLAEKLKSLSQEADGPAEAVAALLSVREVFSAQQASLLQLPVAEAAESLWRQGSRDAVAELASS